MRVLVTGGAGFVGSSLAVALRESSPRSDIVSMDNLYRRGSELTLPRLREHGIGFHWGDVRDPATYPDGPFDLILECSAEPSVLAGLDRGTEYVFHTNLTGVLHCLEKARAWGGSLLFLSTSRVYPVQPLAHHSWRETPTRFVWLDDGEPGISSRGVSEDVAMQGARSLYGYTKYAAEGLIEEYRAAYGLKAVINRCGVISGPWQFGKVDQGVIAHWVLSHLFGRPLSYVGFGGGGKQVRDCLHIDDLCALVLAQARELDAWDGWRGNVSGGLGCSTSLQELTAICREVTGNNIPVTPVPETRPNDLRLYIGDCSRLFARTDWRPRKSMRTIVADTVAWALMNRQSLEHLETSKPAC